MVMKTMRATLLLPLLLAVAALPASAGRGDDSNRKSKNGKTEGTIDGVAITLEYGRPNVKGRQIWGGLVPYGGVWRTGADEASTITFDQDVQVQGEKLAAGTYGLFTIPTEGEWTVIFNKVAEQWGAFSYDQEQDALRVTAAPRAAEHVESMEFVVDGSDVVLRWEKLAVPFEVRPAP
jgi:VCBS repeat-containing protein